MPAWTEKDRRQYEHIRKSARERGRTEERAEEVAARTVNQRRRAEGRTAAARASGFGDPHGPLEQRTWDQLYDRARELDIARRSQMNKDELVEAIRSANR